MKDKNGEFQNVPIYIKFEMEMSFMKGCDFWEAKDLVDRIFFPSLMQIPFFA